ncbi:MAG: hypothetical protein ABWZ39_10570, partial [Pseudomonas caspiana]
EFLTRYGCDYIQGYLVSRPQPLEQLVPLVQKLNQRKAVTTASAKGLQHSPLPEKWSHGPAR